MMKKYLKPEISVEKLFSSETIAASPDPFVDANGNVSNDSANPGDSVYMSTQTWWDDLLGGN